MARAYTDHLDRLMGSPDAERAKEQMVAATCSVLGLRREFIGLAYGPYIRPVPVNITGQPQRLLQYGAALRLEHLRPVTADGATRNAAGSPRLPTQ